MRSLRGSLWLVLAALLAAAPAAAQLQTGDLFGRVGDTGLPDGVRVDADPASGDIHHLAGPHYRGIQFHAESILTERGYDLIHDLVLDLLS